MRRALWIAAAVVALVIVVGARFSAQWLPYKSYLPRVDNVRPTPTRCAS